MRRREPRARRASRRVAHAHQRQRECTTVRRNQKARSCDRAFRILSLIEQKRYAASSSTTASSASSAGFGPRRGPLASAAFDLLDRLGLGAALHRRDLARQPVEGRFVKLALGVALLRLRVGAIEVAHDLGDRHDVARVDLGFVFLRAARPHRALDAGAALQRLERALDQPAFGELAHADGGDLGHRHAQRHLVLDEVDDEQLELVAGDFLLLDREDLADAVGRVHDILVDLEPVTLRRLHGRTLLHHRDGGGSLGGTGRVAVFLAVIPRGAPCRLVLRTGLCLAAPRAALRDDDAPRREPAEVFLVALFFKR